MMQLFRSNFVAAASISQADACNPSRWKSEEVREESLSLSKTRVMGGRRKEALVVFLLAAVAAVPPAFAMDYTVGDSQGWASGVDYDTWVSGKTFKVGDNLVFQYTALHSVDEVKKSDYDACTNSNAIQTSNDGNTKVPLTSAGSRYFICGTPGHCSSGMKLAVTVSAASSTSPSPTTPPGGSTPVTPAATPPSTPVPSAKSPPTSSTTPTTTTDTKNNGAAGRLGEGVALVVTAVLVLGLRLLG
ncbi:hypothetical protein HPP92_001534 [Vanilla planifolia]|uniref:Phytocyanin domain-containing protein n=1 Tax=Vanilla planifolia TaxID=51239 RepID=A0A835RU59_VANPL|nr:hypothetical protein HPP92_001534 [Vanilla planifolia]